MLYDGTGDQKSRMLFLALRNAIPEMACLHLPDLNPPFVIQTNASSFCKSSMMVEKPKEPCKMPGMVSAFVSPVNYSIEYESGALNKVADALSRGRIQDTEEQTHLKSLAVDESESCCNEAKLQVCSGVCW